jgi:ParB/RepB/Spo0J family partition protein
MSTATETETKPTKKGKKPLKVAGVALEALPPWADGARERGGSGDGRTVKPVELRDSPLNPRRKLDARAVHEIASSIRQHGWFGELLAREVALDAAGNSTWIAADFAPGLEGYAIELVFGHHRKAAALLAGLEHVRVEVRPLSDQQVARLQMIENLARGDLHPLEECAGFMAMLALGDTAEEIAAHVGRPLAFVRRRLALAQLGEAARAAFDGGHMLVGHAELLAGIPHADQDHVILEHNLQGTHNEWEEVPTVRDLTLVLRDEVLLGLGQAPWELHDAGLVPEAGACSACPKRTQATPDLWPGLALDDRCTDRTCFQGKLTTFVARQKERAAERAPAGREVLEVSSGFRGYLAKPEKGAGAAPLPRDAWKPIGGDAVDPDASATRCASAQPAVIVDGNSTGKSLDVCADQACRTHWGRGASAAGKKGGAGDANTKAAAKKERDEAKVKKAAQVIVMGLVVRNVIDGGGLGHAAYADDLRMVARTLWRALWQDVRFAWANFQPGSSGDVDHDTAEALFEDSIGPNRNEEELDAVLVGLALAQDVTHPRGDGGKAEELARAAKRHGVDAKAVMRDAKDATVEPEKPAKAETNKAKAKKAGTKKKGKAKA